MPFSKIFGLNPQDSEFSYLVKNIQHDLGVSTKTLPKVVQIMPLGSKLAPSLASQFYIDFFRKISKQFLLLEI